MQPTPVFLPGESHGQRSLAGYSQWGHRVGHDLATKQQQIFCFLIWELIVQVFNVIVTEQYIYYMCIFIHMFSIKMFLNEKEIYRTAIRECVCTQTLQSCLTFVTPWMVARQTPLSLGFSKQEYWSGLPFPPPGYFPDPGIEPMSPVSPALQVGSLPSEPVGKPSYRKCVS